MDDKEKELPLWFVLLMCGMLMYSLVTIISYEGERLTDDKKQKVRESFSPMSDGEDILNAYSLQNQEL